MNLRIRAIRDPGDLAAERLVFRVSGPGDVGEYAVFDTEAGRDGGPTNRLRRAYWFPDKRVKAGDLVVLYSKSGEPSQKTTPTGSISHFFYWGLTEPTWTAEVDCAVLLHVDNWAFHLSERGVKQKPR